jgi:hypothetical protein
MTKSGNIPLPDNASLTQQFPHYFASAVRKSHYNLHFSAISFPFSVAIFSSIFMI